MNEDFDTKLRARFERWRQQQCTQAPDFGRVWDRAARRERIVGRATRRWVRFALPAVGVACAGMLAVISFNGHRAGERRDQGRRSWDALLKPIEVEIEAGELMVWDAPTDFLLRTESNQSESALLR